MVDCFAQVEPSIEHGHGLCQTAHSAPVAVLAARKAGQEELVHRAAGVRVNGGASVLVTGAALRPVLSQDDHLAWNRRGMARARSHGETSALIRRTLS